MLLIRQNIPSLLNLKYKFSFVFDKSYDVKRDKSSATFPRICFVCLNQQIIIDLFNLKLIIVADPNE